MAATYRSLLTGNVMMVSSWQQEHAPSALPLVTPSAPRFPVMRPSPLHTASQGGTAPSATPKELSLGAMLSRIFSATFGGDARTGTKPCVARAGEATGPVRSATIGGSTDPLAAYASALVGGALRVQSALRPTRTHTLVGGFLAALPAGALDSTDAASVADTIRPGSF